MGVSLVPSAFYDRFTVALARFLTVGHQSDLVGSPS